MPHVRLDHGRPALDERVGLLCVWDRGPWEGEKFAVLRYVVMTEGAINDALEALRRTRLDVRGP